MAFGGILLLNFILMILFGLTASGIVALAFGLVFGIRFIGRKMMGRPAKKRGLAASIGCMIAGALLLFLPVMTAILSWPNEKVVIKTDQGEVKISERKAKNFGWALHGDDVEKVDEMLKKDPELLDYTMENLTPLGVAIDAESIQVAAYLLERGVDVNRVDNLDFDTSMTLACKNLKFRDRQFNFEILNLLMNYGADMNEKINGTTPVQFLISYILEDQNATMEELELLERFINEGADLTVEDMSGDDALACFEDEVEGETLTKTQRVRIQEMRELLEKYHEQQSAAN